MARSENVSDDDVVEKARDGLASVRIAALTLLLSRASFLTGHRVEKQARRVSCAPVVVRRRSFGFGDSEEKRYNFLTAVFKRNADFVGLPNGAQTVRRRCTRVARAYKEPPRYE